MEDETVILLVLCEKKRSYFSLVEEETVILCSCGRRNGHILVLWKKKRSYFSLVEEETVIFSLVEEETVIL